MNLVGVVLVILFWLTLFGLPFRLVSVLLPLWWNAVLLKTLTQLIRMVCGGPGRAAFGLSAFMLFVGFCCRYVGLYGFSVCFGRR